MKLLFKVSLLLLLVTGCSTEDDTILCDTGSVGFRFEVVEQSTEVNLFESGFYKENQVHIEDSEEKRVDFTFINEINQIDVLLGWETKSDIYTVSIGDDIQFDIIFALERSTGGSCSSTRLTELQIEGVAYETSETSEITTIFINPEILESSAQAHN